MSKSLSGSAEEYRELTLRGMTRRIDYRNFYCV